MHKEKSGRRESTFPDLSGPFLHKPRCLPGMDIWNLVQTFCSTLFSKDANFKKELLCLNLPLKETPAYNQALVEQSSTANFAKIKVTSSGYVLQSDQVGMWSHEDQNINYSFIISHLWWTHKVFINIKESPSRRTIGQYILKICSQTVILLL